MSWDTVPLGKRNWAQREGEGGMQVVDVDVVKVVEERGMARAR
jgi:hypothetical protein